ncbi:MAG: murein biosynthesis integral membrane protein MurJ [bacterium]
MNEVKKFWYFISKKKLTVSSAAIILGTTYLASNILGMVRESLISSYSGTLVGGVHLTDIFYASFRIPDLIFNLLVLGAVSSAFIPVYVDYLSEDKKEESNLVASNFMNFLLISTVVFGILAFLLSWKLVPLLLPGIFLNGQNPDPIVLNTTVSTVRLMLLSPIFFAISSVFGAILNSKKRFLSFALAPLIYNLSIIIGIVFFTKIFKQPLYGLTAGVILGAFLQMLIQLPGTLMSGWRWRPVFSFDKHELPKIIKLMIPRTIAIGVGQINLIVDTIVASFFVGGITQFTFANDIQTLPTVVFGIAIATAVFPFLAEQNSKKEKAEFLKTFSEAARNILYFIIPATIGILILRAQIVRLVFGWSDNFDMTMTELTALTLGCFALGLVAQGLIPLLIRTFYSLKDTKTPLFIGIIVVAVNAVLSIALPYFFHDSLGIAGVALAFSIAGFVNIILLFWYLHKRLGVLDKDNKIFVSTSRLVFASLIMGLAVWGSLQFFDIFVETGTVIGIFTQTLASILVGVIVYFSLTWAMGCEETVFVMKKLGLKKT